MGVLEENGVSVPDLGFGSLGGPVVGERADGGDGQRARVLGRDREGRARSDRERVVRRQERGVVGERERAGLDLVGADVFAGCPRESASECGRLACRRAGRRVGEHRIILSENLRLAGIGRDGQGSRLDLEVLVLRAGIGTDAGDGDRRGADVCIARVGERVVGTLDEDRGAVLDLGFGSLGGAVVGERTNVANREVACVLGRDGECHTGDQRHLVVRGEERGVVRRREGADQDLVGARVFAGHARECPAECGGLARHAAGSRVGEHGVVLAEEFALAGIGRHGQGLRIHDQAPVDIRCGGPVVVARLGGGDGGGSGTDDGHGGSRHGGDRCVGAGEAHVQAGCGRGREPERCTPIDPRGKRREGDCLTLLGDLHHADGVVRHVAVGASPGHLVDAMVPGVVDVDLLGGVVVSDPQHGVARDVDQHGSSRVDLGLELAEGEPQRVVLVAVYVLAEVGHNVVAAVLHVEPHAVQPVAEVSLGQWRAVRVVPEPRAPIRAPSAFRIVLVGSHEVGEAVAGAGGVVGCPVPVVWILGTSVCVPVVVDVPLCRPSVQSHVAGHERAFAAAPGRVGGGTHAPVGASRVHAGEPVAIIVPAHHACGRGRAAVCPVERGDAGERGDAPAGSRRRQRHHRRRSHPRGWRTPRDHHLHNLVATAVHIPTHDKGGKRVVGVSPEGQFGQVGARDRGDCFSSALGGIAPPCRDAQAQQEPGPRR